MSKVFKIVFTMGVILFGIQISNAAVTLPDGVIGTPYSQSYGTQGGGVEV